MSLIGGLAQLGEHLPYKQRVGGSIPSSSTKFFYDSKINKFFANANKLHLICASKISFLKLLQWDNFP